MDNEFILRAKRLNSSDDKTLENHSDSSVWGTIPGNLERISQLPTEQKRSFQPPAVQSHLLQSSSFSQELPVIQRKVFSSLEEAQREYDSTLDLVKSMQQKMAGMMENYGQAARTLEEQYQIRLRDKDAIIESYRSEVSNLKKLLDDYLT